MVELPKLREFMKAQAEEDRKRKWVQVEGEDLDDALRQAAIELSLPVKNIEYEIRDPGKKGAFGMGKKNCVIVAYPAVETAEVSLGEDSFDLGFESGDEAVKDVGGAAIVRLFPEGIFVKVKPPQGSGAPAQAKQLFDQLSQRGIDNYDKSLVQQAVKNADDKYIKIGDFDYNPANDAVSTVDITDFDMKAFVVMRPPGNNGADATFDGIVGFLKNNGVVYGIKEEVIRDLVDFPKYDDAVLVAEGTSPVNGADARIVYNFEVDRSHIKLKEKNGRVDFKESNLIQNVVEGQALAKKVPPEEGTPGRTVIGKYLQAKNGKDTHLSIGKNVKLSDDGNTAIATINGQVVLQGEKINVEPVYVVDGDVNLKTGGNVTFLGTVMVKGSVEDGFKVKASGNIEVMGTVGKAELDAEGDILVHQGIAGKHEGIVRAGRGVWAKFIENAHIESGELVVASDGIVNSHVDANQRIICQGKRATIVGGRLRAAEEIHAKTLGSMSGSETVLEVGYDPKSTERVAELNERLGEIESELDKIKQDIATIQALKKKRNNKLPKEKIQYLKEVADKKKEIEGEKSEKEQELEDIQNYLAGLKVKGRVSASDRVFPGVKIVIKDQNLTVRQEQRQLTYVLEKNLVTTTKYIPLEEDYSQKDHVSTTD